MLISNLKVFNDSEIMAVCPNVKCNCIYKQSDIMKQSNGETRGGWQRGLEPSLHDRPS